MDNPSSTVRKAVCVGDYISLAATAPQEAYMHAQALVLTRLGARLPHLCASAEDVCALRDAFAGERRPGEGHVQDMSGIFLRYFQDISWKLPGHFLDNPNLQLKQQQIYENLP